MIPEFVTKHELRALTGITSTEINDNDLDEIIAKREFDLERRLNTVFTPRVEIERYDGNGMDFFNIQKGPVLAVRFISNDGTQLTLSGITFNRSGLVRRKNTSGTTGTLTRFQPVKNGIVVKFVYGRVKFPTRGGTETTLSSAASAGTSVALSVGSETGFQADDWVEIYGTDGEREAAKVTSTASGTITVDEISYDHASGSFVRKLELPSNIQKLLKYEICLEMIAREIGQSFDDIVGYEFDEFRVQKGEPYTQWREAAAQFKELRNELLKEVRPFTSMY